MCSRKTPDKVVFSSPVRRIRMQYNFLEFDSLEARFDLVYTEMLDAFEFRILMGNTNSLKAKNDHIKSRNRKNG